MKFSEKMSLMVILEFTKNQDSTFSFERHLFGKITGGGGGKGEKKERKNKIEYHFVAY